MTNTNFLRDKKHVQRKVPLHKRMTRYTANSASSVRDIILDHEKLQRCSKLYRDAKVVRRTSSSTRYRNAA